MFISTYLNTISFTFLFDLGLSWALLGLDLDLGLSFTNYYNMHKVDFYISEFSDCYLLEVHFTLKYNWSSFILAAKSHLTTSHLCLVSVCLSQNWISPYSVFSSCLVPFCSLLYTTIYFPVHNCTVLGVRNDHQRYK